MEFGTAGIELWKIPLPKTTKTTNKETKQNNNNNDKKTGGKQRPLVILLALATNTWTKKRIWLILLNYLVFLLKQVNQKGCHIPAGSAPSLPSPRQICRTRKRNSAWQVSQESHKSRLHNMQVRSMYCVSGTKQLQFRPLKQIFEPCYKMWYRENPSFSFSSSSTVGCLVG